MDGEQSQRKRKRVEEESTEGASTSSFISLVPTTQGGDQGGDQYDVFLSFRGSDTRKKFTDHLYHRLVNAGIVPVSVFKDDNSIPIGEEFGSQIRSAISQSKILIPIISKNYATSKWCLRELIDMIDCKNRTSHIVLPIFYEVKPSDVRCLKGSFGDAFRSSQKHLNEEDILKGQQALNKVSFLQGWESEKFANGHEGELVERVVETIISKLQEDFQLDVPQQLVGLDGRMKEIMNWIGSPSMNARMIGIYGMGGIGKTTLAKCIYNQLLNKFGHSSFLPDVRETIRQKGITYLQSQLISDILQSKNEVSRIDYGINIIKTRFRGKKVLILLDDIDDKNHLDALAKKRDWFKEGSLIIVTTRNEAVLDQSEFEVDCKYKLKELDMIRALLLFNKHAFRNDHSPRDFEGISGDIVSTMGGLPLALQVVGSYLYKKNRKVWEDVRKQLKNQPHRDVQNILRISYDALQDEHKQIFLDIVCFFIGIHKDSEDAQLAMYMWEDGGFYPNQGIEELKLRCLIKIGDDGHFMVHDQLRDLGRSIFCQGQPLEKHSGPWDDNYEGVPRVLRRLERRPWFHDFLGAASSGDSKFSEVRWLEWGVYGNDASKETINLHLPKLSVLDLQGGITENWEGWNSFKASKQLKVLSLGWCHNLRCTPELSAFAQLKILLLSDCDGLEHLHPSIGKLTSLVTLDLCSCEGLKELPEEVGGLKDLEELLLDHSGITAIPSSIGSLRKLKKLSAFMCESLREIPSSIGDLQNLQYLNLNTSAIEKLPSAIGGLKNLQFLDLTQCRSLKGAIPSEIGDLPSLETIGLHFTSISDLPESVRSLPKLPSSLQSLYLRGCKELRSLPELPSSLQSLDLRGCKELRSLPELPLGLTCLSVTCQSLGLPQFLPLIHLERLDLEVRHLLEDIRELSSIALKLCFEEWDKLTSLSLNKLTHLEELSIKRCSSIKTLGLSGFIHLKRLCIEHCDSLVEIEGCDNLESLEVIFLYFCKSLKKFKASGCGNLIEIQGLDGAKSLEELDFTGCKSMETLPDLTGCEKLRSLKVRDCNKLAQLRGLEMLNLTYLDIFGCDSLENFSYECKRLKTFEAFGCGNLVEIQGLNSAKFLKKLDLTGCKSMETLPDLTGCEKLQSLIVRDCKKLTQFRGLKMLDITYLDISGCDSLEAIPKLFLYECVFLKTFKASGCSNLVEIQGLDDAKFLDKLDLTGCKSMETLPDLTRSEVLRILIVRDCKKLTQLRGLKMLSLNYLDISGCDSLEAIPKLLLYECKWLRTFKAFGCSNLVEIQGLDGVKSLEMLDLTGCKSMETLPDLIGFEKLRFLIVRDCKKLTQLQGLKMWNLTFLNISGCDSLEAIPKLFLYECKRLKTFKASGCGNLVEIQGLDGAKFLEVLDLTGCKSMEALPDLTGFEKLRFLIVRDCKKLTQLRGLKMLNLTYLDISSCDSLEAIPKLFLYECKRLKTFKASRCGNLVEIQGLDGAKFLEMLDLTGCKSMEALPNLTGFEKLRYLIVRDCKKLAQLRGLEMLNLTYLDISGCDSLEAIPNLSRTHVSRNYELHPRLRF